MKKYYFNDGTAQQGPFTLEELQAKNITASTPVWYDGLPDWTTAGQVEELKSILAHTPPPFHPVTPAAAEPVKPVTPVAATTVTVSETPTPAATVVAAKAPAKSAKKSTAWLSYVLGLLVLGGIGYLVYQDMEKNKGNTNNGTTMISASDNTTNTAMLDPTTEQPISTTTSADDTAKTETTTMTTEPETTTPATTTTTTVTPTTTQPATVTTTKTTVKPVPTKPTPAEIKTKQLEAQKLAQKKAEEEKKKLQAAQAALAAAAAKEKDYRNNWPKYITFGRLDFKDNGDGIDAFNVPVYNGTNAMLDKVTVRVDYMKKDKKVVKSETIFIYNIAPGTGVNGKAPESKKGNNVKVFITGVTSRKLYFCFPANNGNPADPYFCN